MDIFLILLVLSRSLFVKFCSIQIVRKQWTENKYSINVSVDFVQIHLLPTAYSCIF